MSNHEKPLDAAEPRGASAEHPPEWTTGQPTCRATAPGAYGRWSLVGTALAIVVLVGLVFRIEFMVDDAFITFRYARSWAEWSLPVFNSFEWKTGYGNFQWGPEYPKVEGYSNLLWTRLLGYVHSPLGLDLVTATPKIQLGIAVWTLILVARGAARIGLGPVGRVGAPLVLATSAPFVAWSSGGMETGLFTALLALLFIEGLRPAPRILPLVLAAVLVTLVRVEGFAWAIGTLLALTLGRKLTGGGNLGYPRRLFYGAIAATVALALHLAYRRANYGEWLPNTVIAKTGGDPSEAAARGLRYLGSWALVTLTPMAALACAVPALRTADAPKRAAALSSLGVVAGFAAYAWVLGGDWMPFFRFLAPAAPVLALLIALGLDRIKTPIGLGAVALLAAGQSLALFNVHVAPQSALESLRFRSFATGFKTEAERIDAARTNLAYFETLGHALAAGTVPGDVLAFGAIGSTGWYAKDLDFLDRNGLVTPEVSRRPMDAEGDGRGTPGHEKRVPHAWFLDHGSPKANYLFATLQPGALDPRDPRVLAALKERIRSDPKLRAPAEAALFARTVLKAVPITGGPAAGNTLLLLERSTPEAAAEFWAR